jgi:uncharacterized protein (DUF983 family)
MEERLIPRQSSVPCALIGGRLAQPKETGLTIEDRALYPRQPPIATGLRGRCPRCGEGALFDGFLRIAPRCRACGLDFGFADSADGPAVFVILLVGFVVAGAALIVEIAYAPPIWVHVVLWGPLVLLLCLGLLRPLKGVLVALQYVHRAEEGRIDRRA